MKSYARASVWTPGRIRIGRAYPLKVEFAGRGGQYLGDVHVTLFQHGVAVAAISCSGPWVLFRLSAGKYRIDANIEGRSVSSAAIVPGSGQSRVILRYPDLGGEIGTRARAGDAAFNLPGLAVETRARVNSSLAARQFPFCLRIKLLHLFEYR